MNHTISSKLEIAPSERRDLSREFCVRACAFYNRQSENAFTLSSIWQRIIDSNSAICSALSESDAESLGAYLATMYHGEIVNGLDDSMVGFEIEERRNSWLEKWKNTAIRSAQSIGAIDAFNPEQDNHIDFDVEDLVSMMEGVTQRRIHHSGGGDIFGVRVGDRMIPMKTLVSIAVNHIIRNVVPKGAKGLEIGAGLGFDASFAEGEYHTVDLPLVSVLQAYMLSATFGEDAVWFDGEKRGKHHRFFIHGKSPHSLKFDYVLNHDSLPEISESEGYYESISKWIKTGGLFISINHESRRENQIPVKDLCDLKRIFRFPAWFRDGYVVEMYQK